MEWYDGSIPKAINESKDTGSVFVVYVEGDDDTSKKITSCLDAAEVSSKLMNRKHFVAIKLQGNSLQHRQFAEIYNEVPCPSIFFVGDTGRPVEIITDVENSQELADKIEGVISKSKFRPAKRNTASPTEKFLENEKKPTFRAPPDVECENGVCGIKTSPSTSRAEPDRPEEDSRPTKEEAKKDEAKSEVTKSEEIPQEISQEEKVRRAQELIEQQRLQKAREEKEKEKLKEIERRKMGQGVQQLKVWQEDQEMKQLKEEREKEKRENKAARDRVLAQIAQDKAERAARFSTSPPQPSTSAPTIRRPVDNTVAKLQFKMPDGSTHTHEFRAEDTLETVRSYVSSNLDVCWDFTLATNYPRHEFDFTDITQSLETLGLVPNAVLLVLLPRSIAPSTSVGGGFSAIMWAVFGPIIGIFSYIKSWIFGQPRTTGSPEPAKRPASQDSEPQTSYQTKRLRESTVIRRQGNIARLSDRNDSDDENNTWNGNSTQQM